MKKKHTKTKSKTSVEIATTPSAGFPIVGIGASAGGLEALESFLKNVPEHSGMAFVVVQHLDPTHKGLMAELLQRATPMKVRQVKDRTRVQPNCVYVIPPNKELQTLNAELQHKVGDLSRLNTSRDSSWRPTSPRPPCWARPAARWPSRSRRPRCSARSDEFCTEAREPREGACE